ncbi:MAG TPA: aldo/keto reductase [Chloroflexota bacterium]|nr:aldo/keto reductase [Chloroflexota bacterium]
MRYRDFGATGIRVSEIGIGAYPMSGVQTRSDGTQTGWTGTDDQESIALIHRAEELGVNLIDSAEGYGAGHSETVIGEALKRRREKWVVATKVQPNQGLTADHPDLDGARRRIVEACEASLARLHMDTIDLYQLHAIPHEWATETVMDALGQLKREGKVRHYGISTNSQAAIERLRRFGPVEVLQIGFNLLERSADELLHWAYSENIGTLIRVPLAKGMLTGKYAGTNAAETLPATDVRYERFQQPESRDAFQKLPQLNFLAESTGRTMPQAALRFVLQNPGVSSVIAGAKTRQQIEDNAAATDVPPIEGQELERALAIAAQIKSPGWI